MSRRRKVTLPTAAGNPFLQIRTKLTEVATEGATPLVKWTSGGVIIGHAA